MVSPSLPASSLMTARVAGRSPDRTAAGPDVAGAFLALSDGPVARRSAARALVAVVAALVVALGGPAAWVALLDGRAADHPVAAAVGKAPAFEPDEEEEPA
jgi:hypothetical protein